MIIYMTQFKPEDKPEKLPSSDCLDDPRLTLKQRTEG